MPQEISPELCLVDPELAAIARLHLPEPGWLGRRDPEPVEPAAAPVLASVEERRTRRARPLVRTLVATSVALNVAWIAQFAFAGDQPMVAQVPVVVPVHDSRLVAPSRVESLTDLARLRMLHLAQVQKAAPFKTATRRIATPAAAKHRHRARVDRGHASAPKLRSNVRRALHRLHWERKSGARYYNIVFWRAGKRVLDLWPTSPQVVMRRAGARGSGVPLSPGRYLWFVYPGVGAKQSHKYGALLANGVLVVQPKEGNEG